MGELLAEVDRVVEPGQQHLAERDAADRVRAAGRAGGPLGVWRRWADDVRGDAIPAGHFFPEERPDQTAERLRQFLSSGK
jgi:hypothetical protein